MIIHNIEQRAPEWHKLRLGKITGTRLKEVFKSDNLSLIDELIAETITGEAEACYVNAAMQWGIDHEDEAIKLYTEQTGIEITKVGFISHSKYRDWLGMSPDGLGIYVDKNCPTHSIEVKCPTSKKHIQYIRQNQVPNEYKYQCLDSFLINENQETHDFLSFDPRNPMKPLFIYRTNRDEWLKKELEETMSGLLKFREKWVAIHDKIIF